MYENVDIKRASIDDIDMVATLFDQYRIFYEQQSDIEMARNFLRDRFAADESVIYLATGERERSRVALGFTQLFPSFSSVSAKRLWILNDLYVISDARRHGVGRALIDAARQLAIDTDAKGVILETASDNPAKKLYEAYGFVRDDGHDHYELDL